MTPPPDHERIAAYIMARTSLEPADLCFVFGTRHGMDEFANSVAGHFHKGYFPKILIAGGATGGGTPESEDLRDLLVARGVPAANILCERESTNTGGNVTMALPLLNREIGLENIRSLIAVGKISSSRRYLMTLKRHWPAPRRMLLPVNYFTTRAETWWLDAEFRERVLREWEKIPSYIVRGYLTELDETDGLIG